MLTLLKREYGVDQVTAHHRIDIINSVLFAGIIVGQLSFGYLSDRVGRKFGMMSATAIVAVFSLLSASIKGVHGNLDSMLAQLIAWR